MKKILLISFSLLCFLSCKKQEPDNCNEYYYIYEDEKKYAGPINYGRVKLYFDKQTTTEEFRAIYEEYFGLKMETDFDTLARAYGIPTKVDNCKSYQDLLKDLNSEPVIRAAIPVFEDIKISYEISIEPVTGITEETFINYISERYNVKCINKNKYNQNYGFEILNIHTGFESLTLSNEIYYDKKVKQARPAIYITITHWD